VFSIWGAEIAQGRQQFSIDTKFIVQAIFLQFSNSTSHQQQQQAPQQHKSWTPFIERKNT
jgi:hypothetical protein